MRPEWLLQWSGEPSVVIPLVIGAVWFARGRGRLVRRARERRGSRRRARCYWMAIATLAIALLSPIDAIAASLFSAHMVQHLLLIFVAAPLFALGAPAPELWWGLPDRTRMIAARWWRRAKGVRYGWRLLTAPATVFVMHAAAIWFWHLPAPYEAALHNDAIHALEHLSFLGTAVLFWWLVFQPAGHRRLAYPFAVVFVVATMLHSGVLGGLMMYAPEPWYPSHIAGAAAWHVSALEDQQLAGLLMWIPAGFVYIGVAIWLVHRWLVTDERDTRERETLVREASGAAKSRGGIAAVLGIAVLLAVGTSCRRTPGPAANQIVAGGNAARGARTIEKYGCGSCHTIPGINLANGMVGPPLIHWSQRTIVAGEVPNVPDRLITWITVPQAVEPGTAMPNMGVSDADARDIAAYLYTLK
jgi:putative membrane protein